MKFDIIKIKEWLNVKPNEIGEQVQGFGKKWRDFDV